MLRRADCAVLRGDAGGGRGWVVAHRPRGARVGREVKPARGGNSLSPPRDEPRFREAMRVNEIWYNSQVRLVG